MWAEVARPSKLGHPTLAPQHIQHPLLHCWDESAGARVALGNTEELPQSLRIGKLPRRVCRRHAGPEHTPAFCTLATLLVDWAPHASHASSHMREIQDPQLTCRLWITTQRDLVFYRVWETSSNGSEGGSDRKLYFCNVLARGARALEIYFATDPSGKPIIYKQRTPGAPSPKPDPCRIRHTFYVSDPGSMRIQVADPPRNPFFTGWQGLRDCTY